MTIRQKLQKLWDRTLTIKGRTVKLVPLMILLMIVTGASAAMILHYSLQVDTTGEVVLNPYYIKLTDLADAEVDTVPFGQVMQGYGQWTDEFKLVLVNPAQEVHVVFRIAGSLATGVTVQCYDNTTGTPVEWQEGESFVKIMGDGNPTVLILAFMVSTDYSAVAGAIGDFDLVWDAYEYYDPIVPFTVAMELDYTQVDIQFSDNGGDMGDGVILTSPIITSGGATVIWDNDPDYFQIYSANDVYWEALGLPSDIHLSIQISHDGGVTWSNWAIGSPFGYQGGNDRVRFHFSADADALYPTGASFTLHLYN